MVTAQRKPGTLAHQNSICFTRNTQRNSIWRLSVLMRNLRAHRVQWGDYTCCCCCCRWRYSLFRSQRSVFLPTTDCPLLPIRRFSSFDDDHWSPFGGRSIWEKQRLDYARIKWKSNCGCISTNDSVNVYGIMGNAIGNGIAFWLRFEFYRNSLCTLSIERQNGFCLLILTPKWGSATSNRILDCVNIDVSGQFTRFECKLMCSTFGLRFVDWHWIRHSISNTTPDTKWSRKIWTRTKTKNVEINWMFDVKSDSFHLWLCVAPLLNEILIRMKIQYLNDWRCLRFSIWIESSICRRSDVATMTAGATHTQTHVHWIKWR